MTLPALAGTATQINYADTLRRRAVAELDREIETSERRIAEARADMAARPTVRYPMDRLEELLDEARAARAAANEVADAAWWIEVFGEHAPSPVGYFKRRAMPEKFGLPLPFVVD